MEGNLSVRSFAARISASDNAPFFYDIENSPPSTHLFSIVF